MEVGWLEQANGSSRPELKDNVCVRCRKGNTAKGSSHNTKLCDLCKEPGSSKGKGSGQDREGLHAAGGGNIAHRHTAVTAGYIVPSVSIPHIGNIWDYPNTADSINKNTLIKGMNR